MSSSSSSLKDVEKHDNEYQLQRRLLTPFMSKKVPPVPKESERKRYPMKHVNILSRIFFWWLHPTMNVGYKRTIEPNDLYYLEDDMTIQHDYAEFEKHLKAIIEKSKQKALKKNPNLTKEELDNMPYPKFSLVLALLLTFKWPYALAIVCKAASDVGFVLNPLLSKALVNFIEKRTYDASMPANKGIGYAIGCSALLVVNGILINHFLHNSITTGAHCKAVLTAAIFKKSFVASAETKHKFPNGKVTSLMGSDLQRIDLAVGFQPFAITVPIPVAISIALLIVNIGVSSLAGIAIFIVSIVGIALSAKRLMAMRRSASKYTDKRVSFMREILANIKMIKFYSWEDAYQKNITDIRGQEIGVIFKMQTIRNFLTAYAICLPSITSLVAFLVVYGVDKSKSAADIFSSLTLFNVLAQQVLMLPLALATGADAWIGLNRVREYLESSNEAPKALKNENEKEEEKDNESPRIPDDIAIVVQDASFEWQEFDDDENTQICSKSSDSKSSSGDLSKEDNSTTMDEVNPNVFKGFDNISFDVKKGDFVIITGPTGSGKSSLLAALTGQMHKSAGVLGVNAPMLLCGQPWVQNATVRENILFGEKYDGKRYQDVIEACSLQDDLKLFTAGDLTEIGERGITLSGGQKARINLARAVYANREIILLDDVLSAVDAKVGKNIMQNCLVKLLGDKTRVLVTHQLSLIDQVDSIIYLNGNGQVNYGTVNELLRTCPDFVTLMEYSKNSEEDEETKKLRLEYQKNEEEDELRLGKSETKIEDDQLASGILVQEEERAVNQISFSVYKDYIRAGAGIFKGFAVPSVLTLLVLDIFTSLFTNVWLSYWVAKKFKHRSAGFYIGIYVMFTVLSVFFVSAEFILLCYMTSGAAKRLNLAAMRRILHTPMSYMDTTPMGRILNRFTKDTDALDNEAGEQIRLFLHPVASVIGILILCICYLPWFAIAIPGLVASFIAIGNYYQASSREVKRLEALQRSKVYTNFHEVLSGMGTIKSYDAEDRFLKKNDYLLNKMNEAYFIVIANQRWLGIHLDLVACSVALIISLLAVTRQFNISASSSGLLISYVIQLAGLLSLIMRAYTQVENEMNSVERLCYYANDLEQEAAYRITEKTPPPNWPDQGIIKFINVSMKYRQGLPLVLKNLNLETKGSEKIGICGRTGAGKSSIMSALYRLSELEEGTIDIDGIDIKTLGLYDLRSKLSIIPQDPVLFQGSLRKNLDPFSEHDDETLWSSLRKAGLVDISVLQSVKLQKKQDKDLHKFHLDKHVEDEGSNFSLGERQLIALARALVRNTKILILDEATSSVDYETDANIQKTIAAEFSNCTILCIAHRLKTILNYDRILVLEKGEIAQFDSPLKLFNETGGIFRSMCERSNISSADFKS